MLKIDDYKKLAKDKKVVFNWICAALMLVLLVMQFLPYWTFTVEIPVYREEIDMAQFEVAEEVTEEATEATEVTEETAATEGEATEEQELPYLECPHCGGLLVREDPSMPVAMKTELDSVKTEKRSVSINDYVWLPFNHEACNADGISDPAADKPGMSGLENYLNSELGKPVKIEEVLRMPILFLIIAVLCILVAISNPKKLGVPVLAFLGGVVALFGYIAEPVFALSSSWIIHVIVSAIILAASIGTIIFRIIKREPKVA
ncbi:MAG: hypothetical protein IKB50_00850 [Clostridia bacterium]|nr:hypothetical protein [Clostridia bacterium]